MADNENVGFSIDFSALKQQASDMLDKAEAERAEPVAAEPVVAKTSTTPEGTDPTQVRVKGAEATPEAAKPAEKGETAAETAAKAALAIGDDDLVEVTVDGEKRTLPWKEAQGKISGGLKFTQNSQKLAQERKQFEERQTAEAANLKKLQDDNAQLRAFLTSPKVLEYAQKNFGSVQPAAAAEGPKADEIATVGDAQNIAQRQFQELLAKLDAQAKETDQKIADAQAKLKFETERQEHSVAIESTLADIFTKNPVLKAIPNVDDLIRFNVAQLQPKTREEAIDAFKTVAAGIVEELGKFTKNTQTAQKVAAAKQKLEEKSIEPAGGSAPQIAPTSFKKPDGSIDWKSVANQASAMLG